MTSLESKVADDDHRSRHIACSDVPPSCVFDSFDTQRRRNAHQEAEHPKIMRGAGSLLGRCILSDRVPSVHTFRIGDRASRGLKGTGSFVHGTALLKKMPRMDGHVSK